jgi:hypothetical protein
VWQLLLLLMMMMDQPVQLLHWLDPSADNHRGGGGH